MNHAPFAEKKISVKGIARLQAFNPDGSLAFDTGEIQNQITELGIAALVALAGDISSPSAFSDLALGNVDTPPTDADTELAGEITTDGLARHTASAITSEETNFPNDTLQLFYQWTASGSQTIEEIGIFNGDDVMLGRLLTGSRSVSADQEVRATYKVIFGISS